MKKFLSSVPIPMAGVSLGLAALGNLLQSYSEDLRMFCGALSFLFILLVIGKLVFCMDVVKKDFENPIIASVSATIFMSIMQLSAYAYPLIGSVAFGIWVLAVLSHAILIVFYTIKFLFRFRLAEIYPTCFITYVGIIVASVTSSTFQMQEIGRVIFWFGFSAYALMFCLITLRYIRHEVPESAKPLFCIYTAPMSLSLAGYLSAMDDKSLPFMIVLEVLAQLLYLVVLTQLPKLLKLPFYPSYAAFTFPFVITAFALKKLCAHLASLSLSVPGWLELILAMETSFAVIMVGYTAIRYIMFLAGKLEHFRSVATALEQSN